MPIKKQKVKCAYCHEPILNDYYVFLSTPRGKKVYHYYCFFQKARHLKNKE